VKKHLLTALPARTHVSSRVRAELLWYFGYAESSIRRNEVALLPTYAARTLPGRPTDAACRRRAVRLARLVEACVASLPPRHASVLRAAYTPRRWPRSVTRAFAELSPIAVRLAFAGDPWPDRAGRSGLEQAAARRLSAALCGARRSPAARVRRQASRLLNVALVAYARARGDRGGARGSA
jgi:hypothetical protein